MNQLAHAAEVTVLLGIPWEQQDCAALAQRALAACGIAVPACALGRLGGSDAQELDAFLRQIGGRWVEVGATAAAATHLGDLIVTRYGEGRVHLSVLVDEGRRLALTTSSASRSACVRADGLRAIWKVLRWTP